MSTVDTAMAQNDNEQGTEQDSGQLVPPELLDQLMGKVNTEGLELTGPDGVLGQVTKAIVERCLEEELTNELGYAKDDPAGRGSGNSRNGTTSKTVQAELGPVTLDVPRDRNGEFEPKLVPKHSRRLEHKAGNVAAVHTAWNELVGYLNDFDSEPTNTTTQLYTQLTRTTKR